MVVSLIGKGSLLKGASLLSGATAVTSYGAYTVYELTGVAEKPQLVDSKTLPPKYEDIHMKISNVERNSNNYKEPSPVRFCVKKLFDDVKIPQPNNPEPNQQSIEINNNDFLSHIGRTTEGCFNMRTENKDNGDVIGFVELTAVAEDYGLIMQSEINLKKENKNSESYFFNKLLFLKKKDNKWDVQKIISFQRETEPLKGKKASEIVNSPKTSLKLWSKQNGGPNNEPLFQQFDLKIQMDLWKTHGESRFYVSTEAEAYLDGKWYKDSSTPHTWGWHSNIPKGKWTDTSIDELCKQDGLRSKDFCSKDIK